MKLYEHQIENILKLQSLEVSGLTNQAHFIDGPGAGKSVCIFELIRGEREKKTVIYCNTPHVKQWWQLFAREYHQERILFVMSEADFVKMDYFNTHIVPDSLRAAHFAAWETPIYDRCINDTADNNFLTHAHFYWTVGRTPPPSGYVVTPDHPLTLPCQVIEQSEVDYELLPENVRYHDQLINACLDLQFDDDFEKVRELKKIKREWCESFERNAHADCFICCEEMTRASVYLTCCHNFVCVTCHKKLQTCPFCRDPHMNFRRVYSSRRAQLREMIWENNLNCKSLVIGGRQTIFQSLQEHDWYQPVGIAWIPANASLEGYDLGMVDNVYLFEKYSQAAILNACIRLGRTSPLTIYAPAEYFS